MAIPKYYEFFPPIMEVLSDGKIHHFKKVRDYCVKYYSLTDEEQQEMLPSGKKSYVNDRVSWAKTYLKKAGLLSSPTRSNYQITELGKDAVKKGVKSITVDFLKQFKSFQQFYGRKETMPLSEKLNDDSASLEQNPQEQMEYSMRQINEALADDLMLEILKMSPYDFEKLVVQLLKNMGYGEPIATKKSGDEGIDGLVKADKFGFDTIYVQAKQWNPDSTVSRPEIQ